MCCVRTCVVWFFVFKQKTAYDMRISDWSSDVCSSDLPDWCPIQPQDCWTELPDTRWSPVQRTLIDAMPGERVRPRAFAVPGVSVPRQIGRASCRERVCQYV